MTNSMNFMARGTVGKAAVAVALALVGATLMAPGARAETYRFEQGGYTNGATLTLTIEGRAGLIPKREWRGITSIDASFSGNANMPAFSVSGDDEDTTNFVIFEGLADDLTLGNTEGDGIYITMSSPQRHFGVFAFFTPGGSETEMTTQLVLDWRLPSGTAMVLSDTTLAPMRLTSPVPEPATMTLLVAGVTGVMGAVLRQRTRKRRAD